MSFSKENETIDLSNSSDNDFSPPHEPPFVNDPVFGSSNSALDDEHISSSSLLLKVNKRYTSKFKKDWLFNSRYSSFLRECKTDPTKAICTVCNVRFSIQNRGVGDINQHIETKKHEDATKSVEANRSKTIDTVFNIPTTELNKLCAAEGTLVFHGVKHSHSYISQSCILDVLKKCFSDSTIAKNITCSKTKTREIACNVLTPSLTDSILQEVRDVEFFSIGYDTFNRGAAKILPIIVQFFPKLGVKHRIIEFIEQVHESTNALFDNIKYVLETNQLKLSKLVSIGSDNTNVNVDKQHSVFSLFRELSSRLIKGNCYCHILHNSVKHGNDHLLFDIEAALLKIYAHFCRSSVHTQELINYFDFLEQEQKVILKHIRLRWLSLLQSIERLAAVRPIVKNYFLNLENGECPKLLLEFFTSNKGCDDFH